MKMRPSRWILRPFGQPSYCAASSQSPLGSMRKILPNGMSTHQRLPSRSNEGPSRKLSTGAPARFGSDQAVRPLLRNFAGRELKRRASLFLMSWKGFNIWNVAKDKGVNLLHTRRHTDEKAAVSRSDGVQRRSACAKQHARARHHFLAR